MNDIKIEGFFENNSQIPYLSDSPIYQQHEFNIQTRLDSYNIDEYVENKTIL